MSSTAKAMPQMNPGVPAQRSVATQTRPRAEAERSLKMGSDEAAVLNLDVSGLQLPKVGGLNVDGFKPSFFDRLFGKG